MKSISIAKSMCRNRTASLASIILLSCQGTSVCPLPHTQCPDLLFGCVCRTGLGFPPLKAGARQSHHQLTVQNYETHSFPKLPCKHQHSFQTSWSKRHLKDKLLPRSPLWRSGEKWPHVSFSNQNPDWSILHDTQIITKKVCWFSHWDSKTSHCESQCNCVFSCLRHHHEFSGRSSNTTLSLADPFNLGSTNSCDDAGNGASCLLVVTMICVKEDVRLQLQSFVALELECTVPGLGAETGIRLCSPDEGWFGWVVDGCAGALVSDLFANLVCLKNLN